MLKSSLCDYSDAYLLVNRTATISGVGADTAARQADERNREVIFENWTPFTSCISKINDAQANNAKVLNAMSMYNLTDYSDDYSKIPGTLWLCYIHEPNATLADSESFKSKIKTRNTTRCNNRDTFHLWFTLKIPIS